MNKFIIYIIIIVQYLSSIVLIAQHYPLSIDETGVSQLLILDSSIGNLELEFEIGVYDLNGLTTDDCSHNYAELLVGSGVWQNEQLEISSIGSEDLCAFSEGWERPGYIEGNPIIIRVWDHINQLEYETSVQFLEGNGSFLTSSVSIITEIDILGCLDESADNYNEYATINQGCQYAVIVDISADGTISEEVDLGSESGGINIPIGTQIFIDGELLTDSVEFIVSSYSDEGEVSELFILKGESLAFEPFGVTFSEPVILTLDFSESDRVQYELMSRSSPTDPNWGLVSDSECTITGCTANITSFGIFSMAQVISNDFILGCMENTACNFNAQASIEDGSCIFVATNYDCDGNELSISSEIIPIKSSISNIYPNPFNPITTINFALLEPANVEIIIYDTRGRFITELCSEYQVAGFHQIAWDAQSQPSGLYVLKFITGDYLQTQKLILLK